VGGVLIRGSKIFLRLAEVTPATVCEQSVASQREGELP